MTIYVYYEDTDSTCSDSECCGGPSPSPHIKVFSSIEKAQSLGVGKERLIKFEIDTNELRPVW